jgi:GxxExxY protein
LEIELESREIPFSSKTELSVFYKGTMLATRYVPNLIVHGQIIVELKSSRDLAPEHESQLINYMKITRRPVGYLVNFGRVGKVQWKRFVLSEYLNPNAESGAATPANNPISVH